VFFLVTQLALLFSEGFRGFSLEVFFLSVPPVDDAIVNLVSRSGVAGVPQNEASIGIWSPKLVAQESGN